MLSEWNLTIWNIIGLWLSYYLAKRGKRIVLLLHPNKPQERESGGEFHIRLELGNPFTVVVVERTPGENERRRGHPSQEAKGFWTVCWKRERESQGKRGRFDIFLDCFDHPFGFFYVENVQENEREKLLAQPSQALIPSLILIIIMDQRNWWSPSDAG